MKRFGALMMVLVLVGSTACHGPMALSRQFDDWANASHTESPYLGQLMWYTGFIPLVSSVATVLDLFVGNPIDFWGESAWRGRGTPFRHRNPAAAEPR